MILIRSDANEETGIGHVMRCLAIADALVQLGCEVLFVTADHKSDGLIAGRGFQSECLNTDFDHMDGETGRIQALVTRTQASVILVDSYCVTESYFCNLSGTAAVAYIDDIGKACENVDLVINCDCLDPDGVRYDSHVLALLGPKYVPLRSEFSGLPRRLAGDVRAVMVSAGGSDPERVVEAVMERLCDRWPSIDFHFVVGALNPRLDVIKAMAKRHDNAIMHVNEKHMSELMQACDVAISAAGMTLYELCACGTPTITYTLADNQIVAAAEFNRQGLIINIGDCRGNAHFPDELVVTLADLIGDPIKRQKQSDKMQGFVDGNGAQRIAEALKKLGAQNH